MHIVIVEDEPVIAQRIQRQVSQLLIDQQPKLRWFDNFDDAQSYLSETPIDLLLLDLNLHGASGFDLLTMLSAESFHTIIISAYAEQAIKAFEFGVLDFVAKPFNIERLQQALNRFTDVDQRTEKGLKQLAVKKSTGLQLLAVEQLCFIRADGRYTQLNMDDGDEHLHDKAIDKLTMLLPESFVRVHRSYIVNINKVTLLNIASGGSYQLLLVNKTEIPVSRSKYQLVKALLG